MSLSYLEFRRRVNPCKSGRRYVINAYFPARDWQAVYDGCPSATWLLQALQDLSIPDPDPAEALAAEMAMLKAISFVGENERRPPALGLGVSGGAVMAVWQRAIMLAYDFGDRTALTGLMNDREAKQRLAMLFRGVSILGVAVDVLGVPQPGGWFGLYGVAAFLQYHTPFSAVEAVATAFRSVFPYAAIARRWEAYHGAK